MTRPPGSKPDQSTGTGLSGKVAILGMGAWGTALSTVVARAGCAPLLWGRDEKVAARINEAHENPAFLPGVRLEPAITATTDLAQVEGARIVLSAIPAQSHRTVLSTLTSRWYAPAGLPVIICAKGVERDTGKLMSEVVREAIPGARPAVLSGPSFAADVARGLPTAITLAAEDLDLAGDLSAAIGIPTFRPYASSDLIGAQVGGAVKNVLAIACGIVDGRNLGTSARAALTTRGFAEMARLGVAMGARMETLAGLSGLGDLVLTCNSTLSRNMRLGLALGQGRDLEDAVTRGEGTAEGVYSAEAVLALAGTHGVDMPIAEAVAEIVTGRTRVEEAIDALLSRPFKPEH